MRPLSLACAVMLAAAACSKEPEQAETKPRTETTIAPAQAPPATPSAPAAATEKEKAMSQPYANDLGPATLDVSAYPANLQEGYTLLTKRCSACHTAARPLNSQFVEAEPVAELAKSPLVWQVEPKIWNRYVKRMMAKPGCEIKSEDGKKIWAFLAHDSKARKLGAGKAAWKAHREKLLAAFKAKHPARYKELYEQK